MMRLERSGFSSLGRQVPIFGAGRRPQTAPARPVSMAQAPVSARVQEAKRMLDGAIENLRSVENNLDFLEISMGPEAAVQALEEGQASVEARREDYDRALAETSA